MSELPFQCEYAKTGRSKCKGCKEPIDQGNVRIAAMVQSAFFDGKQANWYHETCFFAKQRPKSASEIGQLTTLRKPDRERVIAAVDSLGNGAVLPVAKGKGKGKAAKRAADPGSDALLKDFRVEYSKSSRATCKVCEIKIVKDEVRVCKVVFDTEVGQKYGGQPLWHHVKCFNEDRANLLFFAGGESLPGLKSLSKDDQAMVKKEIPAMKQSDVPVKKLKEEKKDPEELKKEEKQKKVLDAQDKLFFKHRDSLKKHVTKKADLQSLLEYNSQATLTNNDKCVDALADCMTFGALKPCSVCKEGQLSLDTHNYYCSGNVSEWTKCNNKTRNPERVPFLVPDEYKDLAPFKKFKPKVGERIFAFEAPVQQIVKTESELIKPKVERRPPPLKNLDFFIHKTEAHKDEIKKKILKLGGHVSAKLNANLAAVVSTAPEVEGMSNKISEIKRMDIQIVPESIFDLIDKDTGTIAESIQLIIDKNLAPWGSDPNKRVPQDVLDGKSIPKSGSLYMKSNKSNTMKLKLKGGTAVDPDSGLEDKAHVYKDSNGLKWGVVLGLTDVVAGKNSFYKLQLLESDSGNRYWLFRSWGRIGTNIGGNKTENCKTVNAARKIFEDIYFEKTENVWDDNDMPFMKVPGRMYPIDMDYGDENEIQAKAMDMTDSSECKLATPVQGLIKMIFDINQMKKTLLEFELDTEKMPLGKLSRKQITSGYKVLTQLLKLIQKANGSSQAEVIDATNRFYTLIPHDFGIANPPLLDTEADIKTKTDMLDNLLEIEIAYSMMKTEVGSTCPITANYIKLKTEIVPIVANSPEYEMLQKYMKNTHAKTHSQYELEIVDFKPAAREEICGAARKILTATNVAGDIINNGVIGSDHFPNCKKAAGVFKVVREGEDKRFKPFRKLDNRRLLWHGSRVTNFAGILSQGLRIAPPEAPVTGYMFGKGIYFADMVSKSANYCCTNTMNPIGVLLLCEVACGKMKECLQATYVTKLPPGEHSVLGVGRTFPDPAQNLVLEDGLIVPLGTPVEKTDIHTTLLYNEYIVYDIAQVNVKYLFQMKFNYKY